MFIDILTFTQANLEAISGTALEVTDREYTHESLTTRYRPTEITMKNISGDTIEFCPFTANEYVQYLADPTISDLMTLANSASKTLTSLKGEITQVLAKEISGATLTSGAVCTIIQQ